jgi:hypothetical protein
MITIDGKSYPLWSQFVEDKSWIGGTLEEFSDGFSEGAITTITDITLANEDGGIWFTIHGKDFDEGFNVQYGGIGGNQTEGWLTFHVPYCSDFRIKKAS